MGRFLQFLCGAAGVFQLTFSPTPTGGTWSVSYTGQTQGGLGFDAAAADVRDALLAISTVAAAVVTGNMAAGFQITLTGGSGALSVDASALTQAAGSITAETVTQGAAGTQEERTITFTADAGTWQFNGNVLNFDADASALQTAVDSWLGGGVATVSGSAGNFTVTWSAAGNVEGVTPLANIDLTNGGTPVAGMPHEAAVVEGAAATREVQRFTLPAPTGGTFTFGGVDPNAWDANGSAVEAALEGQGYAVAVVRGGDVLTVTWDGGGDQSQLTPDGAQLTKNGIAANVSG